MTGAVLVEYQFPDLGSTSTEQNGVTPPSDPLNQEQPSNASAAAMATNIERQNGCTAFMDFMVDYASTWTNVERTHEIEWLDSTDCTTVMTDVVTAIDGYSATPLIASSE